MSQGVVSEPLRAPGAHRFAPGPEGFDCLAPELPARKSEICFTLYNNLLGFGLRTARCFRWARLAVHLLPAALRRTLSKDGGAEVPKSMRFVRSRTPGALCFLCIVLAGTWADAQWVISGRVVDEQGVGVPNVNIDLNDSTGTGVPLSGDVTDLAGNYSATIAAAIPAGFYDIVYRVGPGVALFPQTVTGVFLAGDTTQPDVTLLAGSFFSGRVIDELGVGLEEVDLDFFDGTGQLFPSSNDATDSLGFFQVLVLPDVYTIEVEPTANTPGGPYVTGLLHDVSLLSDVAMGDVVLRFGYPVSGVVQDAVGQPIVGADVDVIDPVTDQKLEIADDNSDASGVIQILVPEGDWIFEVDPPVGPPLVPQLLPFTVSAPPAVNDLGIITLPQGVIVSGTTQDNMGTPVPDVDLDFILSATQIEIPTAQDNANSMGVFAVPVEPETYDIAFRPPFVTGLAPRVLVNTAVLTATDLGGVVLAPGFALEGNVTDGNLQPVLGVEVELEDSVSGQSIYTFGNDTDALGNYGIRVEGGTYDVSFIPPAASGLPTFVAPNVVINADTILDAQLAGVAVTPPVINLVCAGNGMTAELAWGNGALDYDAVVIERDGVQVASLLGSDELFTESGLLPATYSYSVTAERGGQLSTPAVCSVTIGNGAQFVRGDANQDGSVNLGDAVRILDALFGANPISCNDAGDTNDDGQLNIADAVFLLGYLFSSGDDPPAPFPAAGADPTADALGCS